MNKEIVKAYLMQDVIRLGFSPSGTKDIKSWLFQYGQNLKEFWNVADYPDKPEEKNSTLSATIDISQAIQVIYEYAIESLHKFTVNLIHPPSNLMWTHDMDGSYFCFPQQKFLTEHNQRHLAIQNIAENDIASIIDTLIVHPTPHQHIESPIDNHEIRIGGGITNPFLYLFHLRIQLCPISDRRDAERQRLIDIFTHAIRNNTALTIAELMKVPD